MFDFFKKKITLKEFLTSYSGFNLCYNYCRENYDHRIYDNYCHNRYRKIIKSLLDVAIDGSDTEKLYNAILNGFEWISPNGTPQIDFQRAAQKYINALNKLTGNEFKEARAKVLYDKFSVNNINQVIQTAKENGTWIDIEILSVAFSEWQSTGYYDMYIINYKKDDKDFKMELGLYCKKRENLMIKSENRFIDGELNPIMSNYQFEQFFSNEKLVEKLTLIHNAPLSEFYFENIPNEVIVAGKILSNKKFPYYVITKNLISDDKYEGTFSKTIYKSFHDSGNIYEESEYKDGLKHGKSKTTHDNGQIEMELEFKNDLLITKNIVLYHKNGKTQVMGAFKNVEGVNPCWKEFYIIDSKFKTGIWNLYKENGKLIKSVNYEDNGEIKILFQDDKYHSLGKPI